MGFWDVTKRMLQGKPAFEMPAADEAKDDWDEPPVSPGHSEDGHRVHRNQRIDGQGNKVIPEAEIIQVRPRINGTQVELWATIRNNAQFEVMLDKSVIFGFKQELDYPLAGGGSREFMIFRGERRRDDGYKYAELYYIDKLSGDYFSATHVIEYDHQSDGMYDVSDLRLMRPVRDT